MPIIEKLLRIIIQFFGQGGGVTLSDGDSSTGSFIRMDILNDTTLGAITITGEDTSNLVGSPIIAPCSIVGNIESVTVTTGLVRLYKKQI